MNYGICLMAVAPVRETITHRSEMVTQLLFGELCYIDDQYQNWYKIRVQFDNYEGWVNKNQIELISEHEFEKIKNSTTKTYVNSVSALAQSGDKHIPIGLGCSLPFFNTNTFSIDGVTYQFDGDDYPCTRQTPERLSFLALKYINAPYLWGGRSIFGIDCSGFIQNVFRMCDYTLPRDASKQAELGQVVNFISEAKTGDLLFFCEQEDERITHVGLFIGNNQIIHASGYVRMDKVDHQGIFNEENGVYTHHLCLIKRIPTNK